MASENRQLSVWRIEIKTPVESRIGFRNAED